MELLVASTNQGKVAEFREMLKDYFTKVVSLKDLGIHVDVEETGTTFAENAALKAEAIYRYTNGAYAVLSDDSGLCVNALHGEPGVYSARYSAEGTDEANRKKLLQKMDGITDRRAYFVSALVLKLPNETTLTVQGETFGKILTAENGQNGFGYDCLFYSDELQKSFGVATEAEKNSVSHRGKAVRNLVKLLENAPKEPIRNL